MGPFVWPWVLVGLLALPFLAHIYRRSLKGRGKSALLHPDFALLKRVPRPRWRRHIFALVYLGAVAATVVALARPTMTVPEAHPQASIMLALDVSLSMAATDIAPSRFEAAREALRAFVRDLPRGTRVGLVTFAGYATVVLPPTSDHPRLLQAVDLLRMDYGTVIGDAMLASLSALPSLETREALGDDPSRFATVILLSDGRNFGGTDPLVALRDLIAARVTVHTIGVGSLTDGPIPGIPPEFQYAARFDEATLRKVADDTGGRYVFVASAQELTSVYRDLGRSLVWRVGRDEVTGLGALLAALLLVASLIGSTLRQRLA